MTRYAMAIDVARCIGCQACMVACKTENELPEGYFRLRMRMTVVGVFPNLRGEFRMEQCFHCENSPCVAVCPTGATWKDAQGFVRMDPDKCIGCKACVTACPYELRYIHPDGYADKCTFCAHRVEQGLLPACVETCPSQARIFGDLDDPQSAINVALKQAKRNEVLKPEASTQPKLFYLNAELTDVKRET
jgi:Fe-S-cluster-containing dehydrogenase component